MKTVPYVLAKCAMSLDGFIDDNHPERLILSDPYDFDRVDAERAECDAILIGAEALRKDNPKLLIKCEKRRKHRVTRGLPEHIIKVTVTSSGDLSNDLRFFTLGDSPKIVYCGSDAYRDLVRRIGEYAEIVPSSNTIVDPLSVLQDLKQRGVNKLMIEGGSEILTLFLCHDLVDELQVSIAPFFVGQSDAPKMVNSCRFPYNKNNRMKLVNVEMIGDMALLTYKLKKRK